MDGPRTRFARSGHVDVAFWTIGENRTVDVVYVQGSLTHLTVGWELPAFRQFCERLSSFARLILFDKRGMGLSDRVEVGTLEERMDDVRAIMDAAGSKKAYIIGESEGGPLAMLFAAAHPERTIGLILAGSEVKERITEDWPWGECTQKAFDEMLSLVPEHWGTSSRMLEYIAPSMSKDPFAQEWIKRLLINSATPSAAVRFMTMAFDNDARSVAEAINVPTLIVHRVGDQVCNVENARYLGAHINGARCIELSGDDHVPWAGGDDVLAEIRTFITGVREESQPDRVLATVLFTDIVESTERTSKIGDAKWRSLLDGHDQSIREQLRFHRGIEVKTTGDGFLATFDGPARAIRCASAIREAVRRLGLDIRSGIHTGEIELRGDDIAGIAVVICQRISAIAKAGEILVSGTVVDLVAGSELDFDNRGTHNLKGVPGSWKISAVVGHLESKLGA